MCKQTTIPKQLEVCLQGNVKWINYITATYWIWYSAINVWKYNIYTYICTNKTLYKLVANNKFKNHVWMPKVVRYKNFICDYEAIT